MGSNIRKSGIENLKYQCYESFLLKQVSKMAAVAGLQHHHIGMLRLHQEKQGGDEAEYT